MGFSHYTQNRILDHLFAGIAFTAPATFEIGLSTTPVNKDGTGITEPEPSTGYSRVSVSNNTSVWDDAVTDFALDRGVKTNAEDISFPEATDDWGSISHFFLTAGPELIGQGELTTAKAIHAGDSVRFRPGELLITLE